MQVEVTSIRIVHDSRSLKAFADIQLTDSVSVVSIRGCSVVHHGRDELSVSMPRRISQGGQWSEIVLIEDHITREAVKDAVLQAYEQTK